MVLSSSLLIIILALSISTIGFIVVSDDKKGALLSSGIISVLLVVVVSLFFYATPELVQSFANTVFFILLVIIVHVILSFYFLSVIDVNVEAPMITIGLTILLAIASLIITFIDFGRTSFYDSATKQIEFIDESKDEEIKNLDLLVYNEEFDKIAMSKTSARYLFGKAMNLVENNELYEINDITIQVIDGKIHYVADLKYSSYWKWSDSKTYPGYFKLDASTSNSKVEFVKEEYTYASSAWFGNNIERLIRKENAEKYFVGEPTIEIDDKGKVFYTLTLANPINTQNGLELYGVYLLDAVTGEGKIYKKNELPEWVDGGISPAYAYEVANYYATWNLGRFNFKNKGQKALNDNGSFDNMKPMLIEGQLHYFIEFSTYKNAGNNSMTGYLVMNTRNGQFYVKQTSGESLIDSSGANSQAEKTFIEKKYDSKNPLLYNIEGNMAWMTSLHDGDGLFQQFYIVSATDPNINGSGKTMELAKEDFLKAIKTGKSLTIDESDIKEETKTITVTNKEYANNGEYHYVYLEDETGKMYVYTSEKAEKIIMIQPNQKVKIKFKDLGDDEFSSIISVEEIIK